MRSPSEEAKPLSQEGKQSLDPHDLGVEIKMPHKKKKVTVTHPGFSKIEKSVNEIAIVVLGRSEKIDKFKVGALLKAKENFLRAIGTMMEKRS